MLFVFIISQRTFWCTFFISIDRRESMNYRRILTNNEFIDEFNNLPPKPRRRRRPTTKWSDDEVVRRRRRPTTKWSDDEVVRRRRRPTTKWSDSKALYVEVVMLSDADSFEIEFVRLSAFQNGICCLFSTPKRRRIRDVELTASSSDVFGVGPLRGRTTSSSDAFGVAPSAEFQNIQG